MSTLSAIHTNQSSFPSPTIFTIPSSGLPTRSRYLVAKDRIMSRSTEHLSVVQPPKARHLFVQSAHALPRSISMADLHLDEAPQPLQRSALELRRVPPSIDGLRQFANKQYDTISKQTHPVNLQSGQVESREMPDGNQLLFRDSIETIKRQRREQCYSSYQDMHILSMYSESSSIFSVSSEEMMRKNSVQSQNSSHSGSSYESSIKPKTPTDYLPFETTINLKRMDSAEGERIRRVNARRVQVVEHNYEINDFTDENEMIVSNCDLILLQKLMVSDASHHVDRARQTQVS